MRINCFYTSLLPIISCYALFLVFSCLFSRVCWCCVVCVSPPFLLIVSIFGNFAEVAPPLTSKWRYLLGQTTPFSFHCYCASQKYNYDSGTSCIFKLILNYVTGNHLSCCTPLYDKRHLFQCIVTARHGNIIMSSVCCVFSNL